MVLVVVLGLVVVVLLVLAVMRPGHKDSHRGVPSQCGAPGAPGCGGSSDWLRPLRGGTGAVMKPKPRNGSKAMAAKDKAEMARPVTSGHAIALKPSHQGDARRCCDLL